MPTNKPAPPPKEGPSAQVVGLRLALEMLASCNRSPNWCYTKCPMACDEHPGPERCVDMLEEHFTAKAERMLRSDA